MQKRFLGKNKIEVSALAFGCMSLTGSYGEVSEAQAIAVIHKALDLGITFFDTAAVYGNGANECVLGRALKGRKNGIFVASKFGYATDKDGRTTGVDARPERAKIICEESLKRLGMDCIDLYYLHRVDPKIPVEETVGAMANLVKEGKVRFLGLSEASAKTIRRAQKIHPITALQSDYSLFEREIETLILPACRELGISFVAYKPLVSGFLTGRIQTMADVQNKGGYELSIIPRMSSPENFKKNLAAVKIVEDIANNKSCKPSQIALAWVLAQGNDIIPLFGTKHIEYLEENIKALTIELTNEEKSELDKIAARIVGERFAPPAMGRVRGGQDWD